MGPTGSGKTGASISIARQVGGEIICADSRTIYKGMDIGTAKPDASEMNGVVHYGIDLVEPGERYTVADWKEYAEQKIRTIKSSGKVPMVVGGTGLYVDALIYNYSFSEDAKKNYTDRTEMDDEYVVFGIKVDSEELRERLKARIDKMFTQELFDETEMLVKKYGWESQAMKSDIYQYAWAYMQGEISLEKAKELAVLEDYHLAKRQMTWFKRNKNIIWVPLEKLEQVVLKYIQNEQ